ncbi:MAG: DUF881 domain-containing protein [Candidatus Gracilibacteria bacterium]|jgi:uncharacterized protein YlxW (UPF0749 family)
MQKFLNWKIQLVFILTGVMVGLLVTTQFKSALPSSSYPYDELQAQQELMKSYSDDQAVLKSRILNLRKQIEIKQTESGQTIEKNNLDILNAIKNEIGLSSEKGDGIEITLNDGLLVKRNNPDVLNQSLVQAADLRDVVNLLFSAQAESVAINDQRIIASTSITSVGNTILVNNFHLLPPFTIIALGDPDTFLQRLHDPAALPDLQKRTKEALIQYAFVAKKNLIVPVYNSDFRLKFLTEANSTK